MTPSIPSKRPSRPFIGVRFTCCGVYARVYLNKAGTAYAGNCPKCAAKLSVKAAPGGSSQKFWDAG